VLFTNLKQVVIGLVLVFFASFTWADPYLYSSVCPKGSDGNPGGKIYGGWWVTKGNYWADKWNFAQCNCTSYVANRINMNGFIFSNSFRVPRWGNGGEWGAAARAAGMTVDMTPTVGSVAQWNKDEIDDPVTSVGHVAYVDRVYKNADGSIKSIDISQYNIVRNSYSEKLGLKPGDSGYPPRFIHFDIRAPKTGSIGWFPSVSVCSQASQWFIIGTVSCERVPIGTTSSANCPQMCVAPN